MPSPLRGSTSRLAWLRRLLFLESLSRFLASEFRIARTVPSRYCRPRVEMFESRAMLDASPLTNPLDPPDVNADGLVNADDIAVLTGIVNPGTGPRGVPALPDLNSEAINYRDINGDWQIDEGDLAALAAALAESFDSRQASKPPAPSGDDAPGDSGSAGELRGESEGGTGPAAITLDQPAADAYEGTPFELTGTIFPAGYYSLEFSVTGFYDAFQYDPETGDFSVRIVLEDDGPSPGNGTPSDVHPLTMSVWERLRPGQPSAMTSI